MYKEGMAFQRDIDRFNNLIRKVFNTDQVVVTHYPIMSGRCKNITFFIKFLPKNYYRGNGYATLLNTFECVMELGPFFDKHELEIISEVHKAKLELLCLR